MKNFIFVTYNDEKESNVLWLQAESEFKAIEYIVREGLYWCREDIPLNMTMKPFVQSILLHINSPGNYMDGDSQDKILFKKIQPIKVQEINKGNSHESQR